ncbi:hypothetical protein GF377_10025 [candidate division GN15 bacterium]|nr:hypothetical protein [candidate division GN15 bacterium]
MTDTAQTTKGPSTKWGHLRRIHYYAQGFLDLEDIVSSINRMIEQRIPALERAELKRYLQVSALPLKDRSAGMIVRVTIPCHVLFAEKPHACCGDPVNCKHLPTPDTTSIV